MLKRCVKCGLSLEIDSLLHQNQMCDCRAVETYNHISDSSTIYIHTDGRMWLVRDGSRGDHTVPELCKRVEDHWQYVTDDIMVIQEITEVMARSVRDDYDDHYPAIPF